MFAERSGDVTTNEDGLGGHADTDAERVVVGQQYQPRRSCIFPSPEECWVNLGTTDPGLAGELRQLSVLAAEEDRPPGLSLSIIQHVEAVLATLPERTTRACAVAFRLHGRIDMSSASVSAMASTIISSIQETFKMELLGPWGTYVQKCTHVVTIPGGVAPPPWTAAGKAATLQLEDFITEVLPGLVQLAYQPVENMWARFRAETETLDGSSGLLGQVSPLQWADLMDIQGACGFMCSMNPIERQQIADVEGPRVVGSNMLRFLLRTCHDGLTGAAPLTDRVFHAARRFMAVLREHVARPPPCSPPFVKGHAMDYCRFVPVVADMLGLPVKVADRAMKRLLVVDNRLRPISNTRTVNVVEVVHRLMAVWNRLPPSPPPTVSRPAELGMKARAAVLQALGAAHCSKEGGEGVPADVLIRLCCGGNMGAATFIPPVAVRRTATNTPPRAPPRAPPLLGRQPPQPRRGGFRAAPREVPAVRPPPARAVPPFVARVRILPPAPVPLVGGARVPPQGNEDGGEAVAEGDDDSDDDDDDDAMEEGEERRGGVQLQNPFLPPISSDSDDSDDDDEGDGAVVIGGRGHGGGRGAGGEGAPRLRAVLAAVVAAAAAADDDDESDDEDGPAPPLPLPPPAAGRRGQGHAGSRTASATETQAAKDGRANARRLCWAIESAISVLFNKFQAVDMYEWSKTFAKVVSHRVMCFFAGEPMDLPDREPLAGYKELDRIGAQCVTVRDGMAYLSLAPLIRMLSTRPETCERSTWRVSATHAMPCPISRPGCAAEAKTAASMFDHSAAKPSIPRIRKAAELVRCVNVALGGVPAKEPTWTDVPERLVGAVAERAHSDARADMSLQLEPSGEGRTVISRRTPGSGSNAWGGASAWAGADDEGDDGRAGFLGLDIQDLDLGEFPFTTPHGHNEYFYWTEAGGAAEHKGEDGEEEDDDRRPPGVPQHREMPDTNMTPSFAGPATDPVDPIGITGGEPVLVPGGEGRYGVPQDAAVDFQVDVWDELDPLGVFSGAGVLPVISEARSGERLEVLIPRGLRELHLEVAFGMPTPRQVVAKYLNRADDHESGNAVVAAAALVWATSRQVRETVVFPALAAYQVAVAASRPIQTVPVAFEASGVHREVVPDHSPVTATATAEGLGHATVKPRTPRKRPTRPFDDDEADAGATGTASTSRNAHKKRTKKQQETQPQVRPRPLVLPSLGRLLAQMAEDEDDEEGSEGDAPVPPMPPAAARTSAATRRKRVSGDSPSVFFGTGPTTTAAGIIGTAHLAGHPTPPRVATLSRAPQHECLVCSEVCVDTSFTTQGDVMQCGTRACGHHMCLPCAARCMEARASSCVAGDFGPPSGNLWQCPFHECAATLEWTRPYLSADVLYILEAQELASTRAQELQRYAVDATHFTRPAPSPYTACVLPQAPQPPPPSKHKAVKAKKLQQICRAQAKGQAPGQAPWWLFLAPCAVCWNNVQVNPHEGPVATCTVCCHATCVRCGVQAHPGELCRAAAGGSTHNAATNLLAEAKSQACPYDDCKCPTTKGTGCNHMTCNRCGKDWCWVCHSPLTRNSVTDHFTLPSPCGQFVHDVDTETARMATFIAARTDLPESVRTEALRLLHDPLFRQETADL